MNIYFLVNIFHGILITYILHRFFHIFFDECRVSPRMEFLAYVASFVTLNFLGYTFPIPVPVYFFISLFVKYLLALIYVGSNKKRFFCALLFMAIIAVFEILLMFTMPLDQGNYLLYNDYNKNMLFNAVGPVFSALFSYVFVVILESIFKKRNGVRLTVRHLVSIALIPVFSFLIFLALLTEKNISTEVIAFCSIMILTINFSAFYFYEIIVSYLSSKMEKQLAEEKNRYYSRQLSEMSVFTEQMRSLRHDLKNHAIAVNGYLERHEYDKIQEYYNRIFQNDALGNAYTFSGNTVIDSILNYKHWEAGTKEVELKYNVAVPASLKITSSKLVAVLGNLLDNAIEAAAKTKEKEISLELFYEHQCLLIRIKNHYVGERKKIGNTYLSTKEKGDNHGYGLRNVEQILRANGDSLKITDTNNTFIIDILMHDN